MTESGDGRAARMRAEFDGAFARPAVVDADDTIDLLAIRVGDAAFAVRVAEIRELGPVRQLLAVPGADTALLGLAGLRGAILPVFALAALLGAPAPARPPRWMVVCDAGEPVGLAFDHLDRHLRVPAASLHADAAAAATHHGVRAAVRVDGAVMPVISVGLITDVLRGAPRGDALRGDALRGRAGA